MVQIVLLLFGFGQMVQGSNNKSHIVLGGGAPGLQVQYVPNQDIFAIQKSNFTDIPKMKK